MISYYVIDAFSKRLFHGNPAGVCILETPLSEQIMQQIAFENNLAETAFVVFRKEKLLRLRWFTPKSEIDLCGHATLAAAFVWMNEVNPDCNAVSFETMSGTLTVNKKGRYLYNGFSQSYAETDYNACRFGNRFGLFRFRNASVPRFDCCGRKRRYGTKRYSLTSAN